MTHRYRITWTICNDAYETVAVFDHDQKDQAEAKARLFQCQGQGPHFVRRNKEIIPWDGVLTRPRLPETKEKPPEAPQQPPEETRLEQLMMTLITEVKSLQSQIAYLTEDLEDTRAMLYRDQEKELI